jgi:hypothetical protein
MKIDLVPYLQRALDGCAPKLVDLSRVSVSVSATVSMDSACNAATITSSLEASADAGQEFRAALIAAGFDDLRVFELTRAFNAALGACNELPRSQ